MSYYLFGALFFIIAMVIFVIQNDASVTVQFLYWQSAEISLAVVVILSACAGALITFLIDSYRAFKTGQKIRKLVKAKQQCEQELQVFKNMPSSSPGKTGNGKEPGQAPEN